ncbi:histidine triad nucleotide binding protein [Rhodotorula toruloides]|uniref:Histidine triad nucleotide binding protein n=1 Tax=Rhodotorula toruloides TaxID=5286 RepID=A0A511KCG0_RHOTO|nr:histidine triad nucleotide binding protein [Rhodotorula toruloides]
MTSHFIDRFANRAARLEPSTSPSGHPHQSAAPRPAGGLDRRSDVERAELNGVREEGCTFCNIIAGDEPAFKAYEDEHVMAFLGKLRTSRSRYTKRN